MKILILIVATCVVGALCEEKCVPGTTFMEDCNKCRCGADGQKACTRKMCPPNELSDDSQVRLDVQNGDSLSSADEKDEVHLQTNGQVCSPNEIKMKDCNRCRCANNGIGWFCTRRACPQREKRSAPNSEQKCTPGTSFPSDDGCNTCYCTETGLAACTLKACFSAPPQKTKRSTPDSEKKCTPGTTFPSEDGCNSCFCTDDGHTACTLKLCYSAPPQKTKRSTPDAEKKCTPGTTFPSEDGCNSCFCMDNGHTACTMMACYSAPPQKTKRSTPDAEKKCTPGEQFRSEDGCNTCFCTDTGIVACTRKACVANVPNPRDRRSVPEKECVPGTSFTHEDNCNTCYCTENGIAACTLVECLPANFFEQQKEQQKTQQKRSTDDLPQSAVAPGAPGFSCTPKTSFKYQCNTCLCSDDGKMAGCTFKFCVPGEW